ncbi:Hypothetical protein LUCI_2551 [Lucifera butyrica]|uniref:Uncharacterized protein n=2 Tax=Lucifera butyrica TaxID=1351585 RepID=A0A498R8P8_9FIRM|nr:Hypothetical protein LUCI_2551 [Lucifera butyrica]
MKTKFISILLAPLTPSFAVLLLLTGLYSLTLNVANARRKNHPRAETFARISGWLYILGGVAVILHVFF